MQIIINVTLESAERLSNLANEVQSPISHLIAASLLIGAEEIYAESIEVRAEENGVLISYFASA